MIDKFISSKATGFIFSGGSLIQATVEVKHGIPHVLTVQRDVKRLDIASENIFDYTPLIAALPPEDVLQRPLKIHLTKREDIASVIAFQSEDIFPYTPGDALYDFQIISKNKSESELTVIASKKVYIEKALTKLNDAGIDPEFITSPALALAALCQEGSSVVVHVDSEEVLIVIASIGKSLGTLCVRTKEEGDIGKEVTQAVQSLTKQFTEAEIDGFYLLGPESGDKNLSSILENLLPWKKKTIEEKWGVSATDIETYAIPIGLALLAINNEEKTPNFRQEKVAFSSPWKRYILPFSIYTGACFLTALLVWISSLLWFSGRLTEEKESFATLLKTLEIPYSSDNKPLAALSQEEFVGSIEELQEKIEQEPEYFQLYPDTPIVSDVLAWLAEHKLLKPLEGEKEIDIHVFSYQLVSRPDSRKPLDRYRVRIELEFTSKTPKAARQFHDSLLTTNELVDPRSDVKWTSKGDSYRVSFFLKNKPPKLSSR